VFYLVGQLLKILSAVRETMNIKNTELKFIKMSVIFFISPGVASVVLKTAIQAIGINVDSL